MKKSRTLLSALAIVGLTALPFATAEAFFFGGGGGFGFGFGFGGGWHGYGGRWWDPWYGPYRHRFHGWRYPGWRYGRWGRPYWGGYPWYGVPYLNAYPVALPAAKVAPVTPAETKAEK